MGGRTIRKKVRSKDVFIGRLKTGDDLLVELTRICRSENVTLGRIEALGAVQKATIGYYDQDQKEYSFFALDRHLEILKLVGNISLKDGEPFVHAHITLADDQGNAFGGHLADGTIVFACEYILETFEGPALARGFDETTGLALWPPSDEGQ